MQHRVSGGDSSSLLKILVVLAPLVVLGILTYLFSIWIMIIGGLMLAGVAWRFLIAPSMVHRAEAERIRAEADRATSEADEIEARIQAMQAQTAATQLKMTIELAMLQKQLMVMPDTFQVNPDANGLYPQYVDRDGRLVGYIHTQLIKGRPAAPAIAENAASVQESKAPDMIKLSDMIKSSKVQPYEEETLIGYDEKGNEVSGPLFHEEGNFFDSLFMLADQGGGKSAAAALLAALTVYHGGFILVIDPDSGLEQSLTTRLGPLARKPFLLADIASDPAAALRVLSIAQAEIERPGDYPLALIVDEATMMFRAAENGGEWQEAGYKLKDVAENWTTRGRKRRRRVILLGQVGKVSRIDSAIRDSMNKIVFKLSLEKAMLVFKKFLSEYAETATRLRPGQGLLIPQRADRDIYNLQLPYADEQGLQIIADTMLEAYQHQQEEPEEVTDEQDTPDALTIINDETLQWRRFVARVAQLRAQGKKTITDLVLQIYGITRGGSPRWPEYAEKVRQAINEIEEKEQSKLVDERIIENE